MNSLKSNRPINKTFLIHFTCWALFITYELSMVYYALGKLDKPAVYLIYYPINILMFYICLWILDITFGQLKSRYFKGAILYGLAVLLYLLTKSTADYLLSTQHPGINNQVNYIKGFLFSNFFRGLYFSLLAAFYWSSGHISFFRKQKTEAEKQQLIIQKEKAELENQLAKTKNAYLQQQMNPHMLFNALNFVYNSVQKHSEDAAQCIWLLSEIMRFSIEEPDSNGLVNLAQEIKQVENLVDINRFRYKQALFINIKMEGNFDNFRIIPLILLTLTENIFKHGNLTETAHPGILKLTVNEAGTLVFYSGNLKKSKNKHPQRKQSLGLKNIRIRLDSVYPGSYQLNIAETGEYFELTLTLNLCA